MTLAGCRLIRSFSRFSISNLQILTFIIRLSGRTHDPRHDLCNIIRSALSSQTNAKTNHALPRLGDRGSLTYLARAFWARHSPGGGGGEWEGVQSAPIIIFFVIGSKMMKLGKLVNVTTSTY